MVKRGLAGGSWTTRGKEEEAGDDWARDSGRWAVKLTDSPAASMEAW